MDHFRYFNEFPEDVQRLVFEYAFEGSRSLVNSRCGSAAVDMALVSKQANGWITPLVYRNLSTSRIRGNPIRDTSRPAEFFRNHVKSLSVDDMVENDFLEEILELCHENLVGLAWWTITHNRRKWAAFLLTQNFPSLRKLSVYYGIFPSDMEAPFTQPIFQNLTHLDIGLPMNDAHFVKGTSSTSLQKVTSWKYLQSLEYLIHLHLDLTKALSFRAADITENFRALILDVLSNLPQNVKYFSMSLSFHFLAQAAKLPSDSRQIYDDIIFGKTDSRTLVCYQPSNRLSVNTSESHMVKAFITEPGFSEYLLCRSWMHGERKFRVAVPHQDNDFWEEAEALVRKRNETRNLTD